MINVSILVPSRGSLPELRAMLKSLTSCTAEAAGVELLLRLDADDPDLEERLAVVTDCTLPMRVLVDNRAPMGAMTVQLATFARGRSLWICNDDVVHETYGWDRLVAEVTAQRPGHVFYPDDGLFGPELACFPLLPKAHVDATGFYGIARYERYLIDSIISDLYSFTLDRLVYLPQWKVRHLNAHPVSEVDQSRWFRAVRGDATRGYQPQDPEVLERDQARYLKHVKGVRDMANVIELMERVPHEA